MAEVIIITGICRDALEVTGPREQLRSQGLAKERGMDDPETPDPSAESGTLQSSGSKKKHTEARYHLM